MTFTLLLNWVFGQLMMETTTLLQSFSAGKVGLSEGSLTHRSGGWRCLLRPYLGLLVRTPIGDLSLEPLTTTVAGSQGEHPERKPNRSSITFMTYPPEVMQGHFCRILFIEAYSFNGKKIDSFWWEVGAHVGLEIFLWPFAFGKCNVPYEILNELLC